MSDNPRQHYGLLHRFRHRHRLLLVVLVGFLLSLPATDAGIVPSEFVTLGFTLIVVPSVLATGRNARKIVVGIGLASPAVLVALATLLLTRDAHPSIQSVHLLSMMAFLSFTVVSMMRHLFRTAYVNEEILASAVGVYMLFGFLFAAAYQLHSLHFGVSISQIAHPEVLSDFVYFSFSNQTTVGFGDLVPLTPLVKSISIVQVVGGQMFLVVVMARLVGLHLTTRGGS